MSAASKSAYDADEQRWAAMMAEAQRGDERQYQQLLSDLSTVIERYLISRLGPREFIEDCVQDILLAIHNGRHTYQPGRPFRPWMFAIVRNRSIDVLRKRRSYENTLASHTEYQQQVEALDSNNMQQVEQSLLQGKLINALDKPFRQAIVLTKFFGLSNAEAAERLDISETAVKVRVHRGISKLKRLFEVDEV